MDKNDIHTCVISFLTNQLAEFAMLYHLGFYNALSKYPSVNEAKYFQGTRSKGIQKGTQKECHYRWKVFKRTTFSFINGL